MLEYYSIGLIGLLASMSPGPDFVVVAKNALSHNRRIAIATTMGVAVGILFHSTYCVLGLALVISKSILLFNTVKYLGAAYLVYLGIKCLTEKSTKHLDLQKQNLPTITLRSAFLEGLLTNVLNPKCTLFMLSVFTLVVDPETPHWQQMTYGVEIMLIGMAWFVFLSFGLTLPAVNKRITRAQNAINKVMGGLLIFFAVLLGTND